VETHRPLFFDPYKLNRITGAFIVIDPLSNETLGAGMIVDVEGQEETRGQVSDAERRTRFGHRAAVIVVDDAEAALLLERELFDRGALVGVTEVSQLPLARAAGMIAILTSPVPGALDVRRMATNEALNLLEQRGVLGGLDEELLLGEGI
jgi:hypothetical protein